MIRLFKYRIFIFHALIIGSIFCFVRCDPTEEVLDHSYNGGLTFSNDTIFFDTLFTNVGSVTKRILAKNPNDKAVIVDRIYLGTGDNSSYELSINGLEGKQFDDIRILGKDSLLILIKIFIDPEEEDLPFLVKDSLLFETNQVEQDIKLISWGQDAVFLGDEILPCNSTWTANRPYVIYNSILIDTLCTLTVEAGTRIYAAYDAYIYVKGSMKVLGTPENRVTFRNERLELAYENVPGQWGGILFLEGSKDNEINSAVIRNANFGIRLGSPDNDTIPDLIIRNSIIENMSQAGIVCYTSDLHAVNTLVDNCVDFTIANLAGGNYYYDHCTFANQGYGYIRESPSVIVTDNIVLDDNSAIVENVHFRLLNSIITGNMSEEILLDNNGNAQMFLFIAHSILQTEIEDLDINNNQIKVDPLFIDPYAFNYKLDTLSPAKDAGMDIGIVTDLDGNDRDAFPDIGAYERIE